MNYIEPLLGRLDITNITGVSSAQTSTPTLRGGGGECRNTVGVVGKVGPHTTVV